VKFGEIQQAYGTGVGGECEVDAVKEKIFPE
jgi:hypothetical protein